MKKVVICVPSLATGGAEKFTVELAVAVNKSRFRVIVAITRRNVDSFLKQTLEQNGIKIVDLTARNYLAMLRKQLQYLKEERPDVVHAQIGSILHMMMACKLCWIPMRLYTVHNEAKRLYGSSRLKKEIYKMAFSLFDFKPVAICPTVKQTIVDDMGVEANSIAIVNNGVDIDRFTPTWNVHSDETVRVISVGTLYWIKNQLMTIRVVSKIHDMGYKVELTLLGDGEDRDKIEREIKKNHAKSYIFAPGTKKNVEDYLRNSDIYVSASKTEGLPLSILEAMACGLPVVATNAGGTKDIVQNNGNGFIIRVDDEKDLQEALLKLINDRKMKKDFSRKSRKIAEKWSLEKCVHGYEMLYAAERQAELGFKKR